MASEALLAQKRAAAEKRLQKARAPETPPPGWARARARDFTFIPGQERLEIKASRYRGLTPVLDSFNDFDFPGWNLREALAIGEQLQKRRQAGLGKTAVREEDAALVRFLPGPLPRAELAEALHLPMDRVVKKAKKIGAWLRLRGDGPTPYELTILERLGQELGRQYLDEVAAETAAQAQLMEIEFAPSRTSVDTLIGRHCGGWLVVSEPFQAQRQKGGPLIWWAEVQCAAAGCMANRIQVRALDDLQRSKAKGCRWCNTRPTALVVREKDLRWDEEHIPLALRQPGVQFSYPLRAQGSLALLQRDLEPPAQKAAPLPTLEPGDFVF